jgi:glyoxylase-like metal-dependent hydrolase (beta-lactamase superfamily II)
MRGVDLSEDDVVPLTAIAAGVVGLRVLLVNVFAIQGPSGWVLVDAALTGADSRIVAWAEEHFGSEPPQAVLLTHAHFDHVGALEPLLDRWHVPVYVHTEETPYVTGSLEYPPPDSSVGGGIMARLASVFPRAPIDIGSRALPLPADGSVPRLTDWRWIHTPGHTAGHVSFFRETDRTLIVGDAFCTTKQESFLAVATQQPELHGPPAYFTTDWDAARTSVQRLAALAPAHIAPGHGQPMGGDGAALALSALASEFDRVARPEKGQYVNEPRRR